MKTIAQVRKALAQQPDDSLIKVDYDGYKYMSWHDAAQVLDDVFDVDGWDSEPVHFEGHPREGIYLATVKLTGRAINENGEVVSFTRAGFGRATAQANKDEREEGLTVTRSLKTHDTAASAAGSDAFSKATKSLGKVFGLDWYKKENQKASGSRPASNGERSSAPAKRTYDGKASGPTAKQREWLLKKGVDEDEVDAMSFEEAKARLDELFNGGGAKKATNGKAAAPAKKAASAAEPDDLDEFFNND